MNANKIQQMAAATIVGSLPFPQGVAQLSAEGVDNYHVDYARYQFTFYGADGGVVVAPLIMEGLPAVAKEFDKAALKAAIVDSQQHEQKFPRFSARAMEAGVQGYYAFLRGQRVTYFGRTGDQHTEWFPGADPNQS